MENENQVVLFSQQEATGWDEQIVSSASTLRVALYEMFVHDGWRALGFDSWGAYLNDVSERAKLKPKTLRKHARAGLLEADAHWPVGTFQEGSIRPISDILSDTKGFDQNDRTDALDLAVELAGDDETLVTGELSRNAANLIVIGKSDAKVLQRRLEQSRVSPSVAIQLLWMYKSVPCDTELGRKAQFILQMLSDVALGSLIHSIVKRGGDVAIDIIDTTLMTGFIPGANGMQMSIETATKQHLLGYLNEPARLERAEQASVDREKLSNIAHAARQVILHEFDGSEPDVDSNPYHYLMYVALRDAGMI